MAVFFTADTHFNHAKTIAYCRRPFADAEAMADAMVARWNATVRPGDVVYHLGDFGFGSKAMNEAVLCRLNGEKLFMPGNHDRSLRNSTIWREVWKQARFKQGAEIVVPHEAGLQPRRLWIAHYPQDAWQGSDAGVVVHLHGHLHGSDARGRCPPMSGRLDVGVDAWDFRPVLAQHAVAAARQLMRHYKGGLYRLVGVGLAVHSNGVLDDCFTVGSASHSETLADLQVRSDYDGDLWITGPDLEPGSLYAVYKSCADHRLWVRPEAMFFDTLADGRPRFDMVRPVPQATSEG